MSSLATWFYFVFLIFLIIVLLLRRACRASVRRMPGPFVARFSNIWNLRNAASGTAEVGFYELHQKYGAVVRTGHNHIVFSDPEVIPIIYGIHSKFTKSKFYSVFTAEDEGSKLHDLFSTQDPNIHKIQKRNSSNAYALSSMLGLESLVDESAHIFFKKLQRMENEAVDLGKWLQWYAFDVIGQITFSKAFGFMEQEQDVHNMISQIENGLMYTAVIGQYPDIHKYLLLGNPYVIWLFNHIPQLASQNPIPFITKFVKQQMQIHAEKGDLDPSLNQDFLSRLRVQQKIQSDRFTERDVMTNCLTNLAAGSDTTAISLRAIIYMLIKNPRCYEKLQKEIDDFDDTGKLSPMISFGESLSMPYLQACMREAMRLHPGVGLPLERIVPKGGVTLSGYFIPEGTVVGMNAWVVHKDTTVFGKDAVVFRPERWIESDEETLKLMNRSFLSFGHGARSCVGKNISILEMSKIVPQLLRKYTVSMDSPDEEWKTHNYWFVRQTGLICRFKRREKAVEEERGVRPIP